MNGLPHGWTWTTVGEVATELRYGTSAKTSAENGGVPVLRMGNISRDGGLDFRDLKFLPEDDPDIASCRLMAGDLLFNRTNSIELVGKTTVYGGQLDRCSFASYLIRVRLATSCMPAYLAMCLNSMLGKAWIREVASQQVGQANISGTKLRAFRFPLPPISEQWRIVAEIETQFTRLETALAALHRSHRQIAKCRASVLASAVTGRLGGKQGQAKNWPWVSIADLAEGVPNAITDGPFGSNLKTSHYIENGPRVVRLQNIGECRFIDERACISEEHFASLQKHRVVAGDVLIAALGNELPRACLAPDDLGPAIVKADCIRCRPSTERVSARYLCYALNSFPVRLATRKLVHGVGRPRLNLSEIKSIRIPLPSLAEQAEIVATIEDRFSLLDKADSIIQASILRAARLRQAILMRAFEGRLVPQDPNDEPAEALLKAAGNNGHSNRGRRTAVEGK